MSLPTKKSKHHRRIALLKEAEIKVLKLICDGNTSNEIGKQLFASPRTIERYRQKLLDKAQVRNTAELISWAYKHKILK